MKKTLSIAFAAFALFAFTSCQKENLVSENQEPAHRIVTAVFEDNGTKTTLGEDDTPLWKVGDVIRILDGSGHDDITITEAGRTITFETGLEGEILYAVYPASATTMESCSGSIDFTIPAVQDGTFGSANICVAKGDDKDNLVFSNVTSVLEFSQTAASTGVLRVAVTATNAIAGKLTASFGTDNKVTISSTDGLTGKIIYTTAATAQDKYYVAVAPVETGDITFNYYKAEEETSEIRTTKILALNKIYALTIPTTTYEPSSVEIKMTVGDQEKTYKWAKCNIGATEETDYGRYYAWGDIIGQTAATSGAYAFATAFSWANCPFNNGEFYYDETYFSSVKETVCPGGVLKSDYDVAHKVLGGDWRMPTKEEFQALYDACLNGSYDTETNPSGASASVGKGVYWCTSYDGVAGCLFCDGTNKLFFPAAGNGNGTSLNGAGVIYGFYGFYCSSSLYSSLYSSPEDPPAQYAYSLIFDDSEVNPQNYGGRYCGFPVRPVKD